MATGQTLIKIGIFTSIQLVNGHFPDGMTSGWAISTVSVAFVGHSKFKCYNLLQGVFEAYYSSRNTIIVCNFEQSYHTCIIMCMARQGHVQLELRWKHRRQKIDQTSFGIGYYRQLEDMEHEHQLLIRL